MTKISIKSGKSATSLKIKRPAWSFVYDGYPATDKGLSTEDDLPATIVFTDIFGPDYNRKIYSNACGTRVSLALLAGGIKRVGSRSISITVVTHVYFGKSIEPGADKLKDFLEATWGNPEEKITAPVTFEKVSLALKGRKGIYIMIPKRPGDFGASGHATLWTGDKVVGNHSYISENTHAVYFWELK